MCSGRSQWTTKREEKATILHGNRVYTETDRRRQFYRNTSRTNDEHTCCEYLEWFTEEPRNVFKRHRMERTRARFDMFCIELLLVPTYKSLTSLIFFVK
jgi:hypothetical protein